VPWRHQAAHDDVFASQARAAGQLAPGDHHIVRRVDAYDGGIGFRHECLLAFSRR
jgi:hypothetical protein